MKSKQIWTKRELKLFKIKRNLWNSNLQWLRNRLRKLFSSKHGAIVLCLLSFCFALFGKVRIYQKAELKAVENSELGNHHREQNGAPLPGAGGAGSTHLFGAQNCHRQ